MKIITLRKLGTFNLSLDVINDGDKELNKRIFGKLIVLKADIDIMMDSISYVAYSDEFDELIENEPPPYYQIQVIGDRIKFFRM